jgi:hypothetical protein
MRDTDHENVGSFFDIRRIPDEKTWCGSPLGGLGASYVPFSFIIEALECSCVRRISSNSFGEKIGGSKKCVSARFDDGVDRRRQFAYLQRR